MKNVVYVTGNPHKAKHFSKIMQMDISNISLEVDEIQSLNIRDVVEHKARQAYKIVNRPVIVEDTKLSFNALGALPGPLIKWFFEELKSEGLCRLLDGYDDRSAIAGAAIAYYDGVTIEIFEKELAGTIISDPQPGGSGFGWNVIFKPNGADKNLALMDPVEFNSWYIKIKPFDELRKFLLKLDKN